MTYTINTCTSVSTIQSLACVRALELTVTPKAALKLVGKKIWVLAKVNGDIPPIRLGVSQFLADPDERLCSPEKEK